MNSTRCKVIRLVMRTYHSLAIAPFALLLLAGLLTTSEAATFAVPRDEVLIRRADAIAVGLVIDTYSRYRQNGFIETVTVFRVNRVLKGQVSKGELIEIADLGGEVEGVVFFVPGSPRRAAGEEALLLLRKTKREVWTTYDMVLGDFKLAEGGRVYVRDESEVNDLNAALARKGPKGRSREKFEQFIERVLEGEQAPVEDYFVEEPLDGGKLRISATAAGSTYALKFNISGTLVPARWPVPTNSITFVRGNTHPTAANAGADAVIFAANTWTNDCGSNITIAPTATLDPAASGGTCDTTGCRSGASPASKFDGLNGVLFEDPGDEFVDGTFPSTSSVLGIGGPWSDGNTHTFASETYVNVIGADIVINDGVTALSSTAFNQLMLHEMGHTLGFRHSDQPDAAGAESTTTAIMNSSFNTASPFPGAALQQYDINAVRAIYASSCVAIAAPTNVVATASSATNVAVSWTASEGAASYKVFRSTDGSTFSVVGNPTGTSFSDTSATANTSFLYRVKAVDGSSNESGDSNSDLATTVVFTDNVITIGSTPVKAVHFSELRTAVNAVRTLAGLSVASFTDPTLSSAVAVKAAHVTEMRSALDLARSTLGLSAIVYTDPTVTAGSTGIKAAHVTDLRGGTQ